jgi:citrate lyase beta subunit
MRPDSTPSAARQRRAVPVSYFYTPALKLDSALLKRHQVGADAWVIDLEDSIHVRSKAAARDKLAGCDLTPLRELEVPIGVRINAISTVDGLQDLLMLASRDSHGGNAFDFVLLPKVRVGAEVELYRAHLERMTHPPRAFTFIETVDAVENVDAIASLSDALCFGQADLVAELYAPNPALIAQAQARTCAAAAKYRLEAIDNNSFEIKDMAIVDAQCRASAEIGFTGKAAIHPAHVPIINSVFQRAHDALPDFRATVSDYAQQDEGFRIVDGRVVAPPFVAKAKLMLELHEREPDRLLPGQRRSGVR